MIKRLSCLVAALALAGVVAGCGGDGDDGSDDAVASLDEGAAAEDDSDDGGGGGGGGPSPEEQAKFEDAMLEYVECMRDNGIDMPDPEFSGDGGVALGAPQGTAGPDDAEFQAADEECQPILEEARPDIDIDPEEQAELQDQLVAVAECMRERGYDMPDPEVNADGGVQMRVGGPDGGGGPPDEEFEQDLDECHDEAGIEGPEGPANSSSSDGGEA